MLKVLTSIRPKPGLFTWPAVFPLRRFPQYERRRHYVNSKPLRNAGPNPDAASKEMPAEIWINALENTAKAPWLNLVPQGHEDKLKRAYTLLYQIVLYLGRPQEEGKAEQFLVAFNSALVPPDSEIGRARRAITTIMQAAVRDISSVPLGSSLRTEKLAIFDIFGALQTLHDMHLLNGTDERGEMQNWMEFWSRAQPVVLALGMKLDEEGYGLDSDESHKERDGETDVDKGKESV